MEGWHRTGPGSRHTGRVLTSADEPVDAAASADAAWRLEVGRFRAEHPQRTFPMGVHLGEPAGPRLSFEVPWPVSEEYDAGLRLDLMSGLGASWAGAGCGRGSVWLARLGVPELHDQDVLWHAASLHALSAFGVRLDTFRVVTKSGWLDVRTGQRRTWKRLRL